MDGSKVSARDTSADRERKTISTVERSRHSVTTFQTKQSLTFSDKIFTSEEKNVTTFWVNYTWRFTVFNWRCHASPCNYYNIELNCHKNETCTSDYGLCACFICIKYARYDLQIINYDN